MSDAKLGNFVPFQSFALTFLALGTLTHTICENEFIAIL
jgi:hypothetical protein